jgi:transaldolase
MVGRLDDWLKVVADKNNITLDPGYLEWAGVAVFKMTYRVFRDRGYRIRLLSAAFRNHMHWNELVGGDVVISPPYKWQVRFNSSDMPVTSRMQISVDNRTVECLLEKFRDLRMPLTKAACQFVSLIPSLLQFALFASSLRLVMVFHDVILPNPDKTTAGGASARKCVGSECVPPLGSCRCDCDP